MRRLLYLAAALVMALPTMAVIQQRDSLQRELVLERDFVPTQSHVTKSYFTPVTTPTKGRLKPLDFVKDSYDLGAQSFARTPFAPALRSFEQPEVLRQRAYLRLHGGLLAHFGVAAGTRWQMLGGTATLALEHSSIMAPVFKQVPLLDRKMRDHDTQAAFLFNKPNGVTLGAQLYHHRSSLYGTVEDLDSYPKIVAAYGREGDTTPFPMLRMMGVELKGSHALSPIYTGSPLRLALEAEISAVQKQDLEHLPYDLIHSYKMGRIFTSNEITGRTRATLAYDLSDVWSVGAHGLLEQRSYAEALDGHTMGSPLLVSTSPYVGFSNDLLTLEAGARLHFTTAQVRKIAVAPHLQFRIRPTQKLSFTLEADGGAELLSLRKLYDENRYFYTPSLGKLAHDTRWRAALGIEVGRLESLSLAVKGGYAQHAMITQWELKRLAQHSAKEVELPHAIYWLEGQHDINHIFVEASAKYVSTFGLDLFGSMQYNKYGDSEGGLSSYLLGLPSFRADLQAAYKVSQKIGLQASFTTLAGIRTRKLSGVEAASSIAPSSGVTSDVYRLSPSSGVTSDVYRLSPLLDLSARITYQISKQVGVAFIGTNLLNSPNRRWVHYEQPGTSITLAATITL